jgi:hypothetical protein
MVGWECPTNPREASGLDPEAVHKQLLGEAGRRQVDAEVGLTCNVGGFGNCVIASVLEVAR